MKNVLNKASRKNILFVDDEQMLLSSLKRRMHKLRECWNAVFVDNGYAALEAMEKHNIDVIICDLCMPGMDGVQLLKEVKRRYPHTIRLILTGRIDSEYQIVSLLTHAHRYLSKPCKLESIVNVLEELSFLDSIKIDNDLRKVITGIDTLPVLPEVLKQIKSELELDNPSVENIIRLVSMDVTLTLRLLCLANSAKAGNNDVITDISCVVKSLGMDFIRELMQSNNILTEYDANRIPDFSIGMFWEHSLRTAYLAKQLAIYDDQTITDANAIYLSGLLHDVGKLLLATNYYSTYNSILDSVRKKRIRVFEAECEHFHTTHAEVGAYYIGLLGIRPEIVQAISLHHDHQSLTGEPDIHFFVYASNYLDHKLFTIHSGYTVREDDLTRFKALGLGDRMARLEQFASTICSLKIQPGAHLFIR